MELDYQYISNLLEEVKIPENGILSRTLHDDDQTKVVIFGFDAGHELSEHTASMPATLHMLQGEAKLTLGEESMEVEAGAWVHMAANLKHSLYAKTPVIMFLYLLKNQS